MAKKIEDKKEEKVEAVEPKKDLKSFNDHLETCNNDIPKALKSLYGLN